MASIQKRTLKDTRVVRWDACWRDAAGNQHRKTFERRKDADAWLVEIRKQVLDGTFRKVRPAAVGEVLDAWLGRELAVRLALGDRMKPSTARTYRNIVEKHLRPAFAGVRSDLLTPGVVAKWRRAMAMQVASGRLTKKTYNNVFALLQQILTWARRPAQGYLRHDPLEGIQRMQVARSERMESEATFLEAGQIAALLEAAATSAETNALVHLGLFAGLRRGEALALRWSDVESGGVGQGGRLHVRRAISGGEVGSTKTAYSQRSIDVPGDVIAAVTAQRQATIARANEVLRMRTATAGERDNIGLAAARAYLVAVQSQDAYLFPSDKGTTPVDPDNWYSRTWLPLRRRAGLPDGVGLHSLRHTFASLLIDQGESIKYVSAQLGHSSAAFTLDRYGHLFKASGDRAMGRLQRVIRNAKAARFGVVEGGAM